MCSGRAYAAAANDFRGSRSNALAQPAPKTFANTMHRAHSAIPSSPGIVPWSKVILGQFCGMFFFSLHTAQSISLCLRRSPFLCCKRQTCSLGIAPINRNFFLHTSRLLRRCIAPNGKSLLCRVWR
ncbi:hypothetical protein TRVL_07570 [Trypanosoma vivax]|nr:hypothetical protein TRVL_07570 [Trypanosoma vivax]